MKRSQQAQHITQTQHKASFIVSRAKANIAISGAGIAGLSAALAFSRAGFDVDLFERSPKLEEVGAGLQLSPNATRLLERLGAIDELREFAVQPEEIAIRRGDNLKKLASVPLGNAATQRWQAPYLTIHRADLQKVLLNNVLSNPRINLFTGCNIQSATEHETGIVISSANNTPTSSPYALLIAADGVWSTLRTTIPNTTDAQYSGYLAWRCVIDARDTFLPATQVTTWVDSSYHLVSYPVRAGREINLVAVTPAPAASKSWSNNADANFLLSAMRRSSSQLKELVQTATSWTSWPIYAAAKNNAWSNGKSIVLIGDAAHAMTPFAAQGAAMAIEDAYILASCAEKNSNDFAAAVSSYETLRRQRISRVAARGAFNRFTWHAAGPIAFGRNLVLSLRGPEQLMADFNWLYGYDPDAV